MKLGSRIYFDIKFSRMNTQGVFIYVPYASIYCM